MMNWRRIVAIAAMVLGLLAVIGMGVGRLFLDQWHRWDPLPVDPTAGIVEMVEVKGFTPDIASAVHDLQLPAGVKYAYVAESWGDRKILASTPAGLEGESVTVFNRTLMEKRLQGFETHVTAVGGLNYGVGIATVQPSLPHQLGAPLFIAGLVAAALAWLALGVWIYLDAKKNGSTAALGWGLLGVLAAPLALAVWIISRRAQGPAETSAPAQICPGCGADTPKDAAFCVRCGHGVRPTCPDCHRPVATDWSYCAACGTSMTD